MNTNRDGQGELGVGAPPEGEELAAPASEGTGYARCRGVKLRGGRCKRAARANLETCSTHARQENEPPPVRDGESMTVAHDGRPGPVDLADVTLDEPVEPMAVARQDPNSQAAMAAGTWQRAAAAPEADRYARLMEMVAGQEGPVAVDMLERLVGLVERAEDRDAERAINAALAEFKRTCPPIPKDGKVDYADTQGRQVKFRHSKLPTICGIVDPWLTRVGLSYTWDALEPDGSGLGRVTVCTLQHEQGAKRTARFDAPPSGLPTSADVQKVGAALTYGQRYSLILVLGLHVVDDVEAALGREPAEPYVTVTDEQLATLEEWIESTGADRSLFLGYLTAQYTGMVELADLPAAGYGDAVDKLKLAAQQKAAK